METEGGHCDTEVAVSQDVLRIVAGISGGTLKGNTIELGWDRRQERHCRSSSGSRHLQVSFVSELGEDLLFAPKLVDREQVEGEFWYESHVRDREVDLISIAVGGGDGHIPDGGDV